MLYEVCHGDNDKLFKEHANMFLDTPVREWPDKVKAMNTADTVKDVSSIDAYLKLLRARYGPLSG